MTAEPRRGRKHLVRFAIAKVYGERFVKPAPLASLAGLNPRGASEQ
jgi:hypothetical protein